MGSNSLLLQNGEHHPRGVSRIIRRLQRSIKALPAKLFKSSGKNDISNISSAKNASSAATEPSVASVVDAVDAEDVEAAEIVDDVSTESQEDTSDEDTESTNIDSVHSVSSEESAGESTEVELTPSLPAPSSQFISYINRDDENEGTPTRFLVKPYLDYEKWLRREFLREGVEIDCLSNLVPIYNGQETLFKIRTIDFEKADKEKYLMPLWKKQREKDDKIAIAESFEKFQKNFHAFTHGALEGLDWSNVVVAGSSALLPLLSRRRDVRTKAWNTKGQNSDEVYYDNTASTSDIDIFLYGIDEKAAIARIIEIEALVRKNQHLSSSSALTLRSENAITFISPRWPHRHVQIILRLYKSISEILTGFDVDCSCVAFNGKQVYSNPRGVTAIATRANTVDLSRRSPSYENRLWKYRHHNFEVYWDALDRSRIEIEFDLEEENVPKLQGLARLLYSEARLENIYNVDKGIHATTRRKFQWIMKYNLKKFDDSGDPNMVAEKSSGYAEHKLPYGRRLTADDIRSAVIQHATSPYMFGTIQEVTDPTNPRCRWKLKNLSKTKLKRKIVFMEYNPGRQMIGSFYPLTDNDWTRTAYD
ncbi:hypothetical protein F5Y02DRAFT_390306 [Annulohypoxylon stygium]|nr:hypothetical protein F5Y02DRAFT_390306 [Annulohypoxylon stygium]